MNLVEEFIDERAAAVSSVKKRLGYTKCSSDLYERQKSYFNEIKESLITKYFYHKIGFDFNVTTYVTYILQYELKKKFSVVDERFLTEEFMNQEFGTIMDSIISNPEDNYSIKEALKAESRLSLVTDFMIKANTDELKLYPSDYRRKEKVFENSWRRACAEIDHYFRDRDIEYQEIAEVIEIYELNVRDNGKLLDFHFGGKGFTLSRENSAKQILEYVEKIKREYEFHLNEFEFNILEMQEVDEEIKNTGISGEIINYEDLWFEVLSNGFDSPSRAAKNIQNAIHDMDMLINNKRNFLHFLRTFPAANFTELKGCKVNDRATLLILGPLQIEFKKVSVTELLSQIRNYQSVKPFIDELSIRLAEQNVGKKLIIKEDKLTVSMYEKGFRIPRQIKSSLRFDVNNQGVFRETGESVLTSEVVVHELMEKLRTGNEEYFLSIERAKEMFMAVLSEDEERMVNEENVAILEGNENYYAILTDESYNNVLKIPKAYKNKNDIAALCIHPADPSVPKHDGFASIALAIKSGDEQYILEKSNEFKGSRRLVNKVYELLENFKKTPELAM